MLIPKIAVGLRQIATDIAEQCAKMPSPSARERWTGFTDRINGYAAEAEEHQKRVLVADDYADDDTPTVRLRKIANNMRRQFEYRVEDESVEAFGYTLEAMDQYADHIDEALASLDTPSAGTSAYEMVAAVEARNVEIADTLIAMTAATVLSKLIDEEGGGRTNITFSPADMDDMYRRYNLTVERTGLITTITLNPREGAFPGATETTVSPESLYMEQGVDDTPADPQVPEHVYDRPLWGVRYAAKLYPASDRAAAEQLLSRFGDMATIENRYCYHSDCPAAYCTRMPEATSVIDS